MDENTNANAATGANDAQVAGAAEQTETKTYTLEEVNALLQSETDRRVTAALKKADAKHKRELNLAQMDEEQRAKAEAENRIAELEAQVREFQVEAARSELKSVLASRGLSAEFADLLSIGEDTEANQAVIDSFDKLFKAAVKAEVEKRVAGSTPKGNGTGAVELTKDSAKKMSLADMAALAESNPEKYKQLFN